MTYGRMAVIQDPQGAFICVWQPREHIGAQRVGETGAMCWAELDTTDTASAAKFYTSPFAGRPRQPRVHGVAVGRHAIGGMMKIPKEWGPVPPNWLVYFMRRRRGRAVKKAGGPAGPDRPANDIPNMGRFAVLQDPQGAVFAVFAPRRAGRPSFRFRAGVGWPAPGGSPFFYWPGYSGSYRAVEVRQRPAQGPLSRSFHRLRYSVGCVRARRRSTGLLSSTRLADSVDQSQTPARKLFHLP